MNDQITNVELLKMAVAIAVPVSAAAAGVVKAVLNGTAGRVKDLASGFKEYREENRTLLREVNTRLDGHDERLDAVSIRQAVNTTLLGSLDKRIENIEGNRWRRRSDEGREDHDA